MAALEKSSREQSDKASKLQEKAKAAAKEKKGIFSFFCVLRVVFFSPHVFLDLTELKSLLLRKENDVTDLTNIMYHRADAVEKLTKLKADADKQMVSDMKQIRELTADHDKKAQQLADLQAAE